MSPTERLAKICLAHFPGFGSKRLRKLFQGLHSYQHAWSASCTDLLDIGLPMDTAEAFCQWRKQQDPHLLADTLEHSGIHVLLSEDADMPHVLKHIHDPPEVLFVRGELPHAPAIACVGTRQITPYGRHMIKELIPPLARAGLCLVSGLALGVDGLVHEETLRADGLTLALLATGLDDLSIYPHEHTRLARTILDKGGCLLSESPPGTPGLKHLFPLRNRLIAGLTLATLVIEAAPESGSLITAKLALEENREVLAVPGPVWSAQSEGTNHLLKSGAKVCTSAQDVLDALCLDRPDLIAEARRELPLSLEEQELFAYLSQPIHIDALSALAKCSVAHVSSQLSLLELKGLAQHLGGQTWVSLRTHSKKPQDLIL